jgi:hypothetical protein
MKKSESELINRLNKYREIPITRKETYVPPTMVEDEEGGDEDLDEEEPCTADCENCPNEYCPAYAGPALEDMECDDDDDCSPSFIRPSEVFDAEHPEKKLSNKDKLDIRESINRTKDFLRNTKGPSSNTFDSWSDFIASCNGDSNPRNEELLRQWKEYKEKAKKWIDRHKGFPESIAKALILDEYENEKAEYNNLNDNEKAFKSIVDSMFTTYQKKNADYGDSFTKLFQKFGMQSVLIRLMDKYNRLESLSAPGKNAKVNDESLEDTLLDLANYAILTVMELRKDKK